MTLNQITEVVIAAAIEVHKQLGAGLLESAYHQCMCRELSLRGIPFEHKKPLPVTYKGMLLDCGYELDLLIAGKVIVELKAVDKLHPIHEAQLLTYLKLGNWNVGLLIKFNVEVLRLGIKRVVHNLDESLAGSQNL